MLKTEHIQYRAGGQQILKGISADFFPGAFHVILGPNGSGKSSFLKAFGGELTAFQGKVYYDGQELHQIPRLMLARRRAVMSQQPELSFPLPVEEVVLMGRYPHFEFSPHRKDLDICDEVMSQMNLQAFRQRDYLTLSGGEKQRVQFARALAQIRELPAEGCRYFFLDEPLASLDLKYQIEFLQRTRELIDERTVVIAILHDINLALGYADRLYFLKDGQLLAQGAPSEILEEALLEQVYDIRVSITENPLTGKPLVLTQQHPPLR